MKSVIILGATGQIGKAIYNRLNNKSGLRVVGTSRKEVPGLVKFNPFEDEWKVLAKADVVVNCIGQIHETASASFRKIHVGTTKTILKHRDLLGNPKIIQISALGADAHHPAEFLKTKAEADELLLDETYTCVIRPSIVCSAGTMLVKKLRMLRKVNKIFFHNAFLPKGFINCKIQPILIDDLTEIIEKLSLGKFQDKIVEAVGPEELRFRELIELSGEYPKEKTKIKELPKSIFKTCIQYFISPLFPKVMNTQQFQLLFEDNIASLKVTERILGRKPYSTLEFWKSELADN